MGVLDKLMFWKRDELDFDKIAEKELGLHKGISDDLGSLDELSSHGESDFQDELGLNQKMPGLEEKSSFEESSKELPGKPLPPHLQESATFSGRTLKPVAAYGETASGGVQDQRKEIELINSKLDTIKALLGSLDQKMSNLERAAGSEKKERLW